MINKEHLLAKLKIGELIAWMPEADWQAQRVGAILLPMNQHLVTDIYLSFLADRIQTLLNETENAEEMFYEMVEQMKQESLLHEFVFPTPDSLHSDIFISNLNLQERISYFGITETFPETINKHNPEAAEIFLEMDLENWLSALTIY